MESPEASTAQRRMLFAGAIFDAAFALPMLAIPGPAAALLGIDLPADMTWFRLAAVLLLIVAGAYVAASRAGGRAAHEVAIVAALGRILGCIVLVGAGLDARVPALTAAGVADGALGIVHFALAGRDLGRRWR
jgi:hypothetical protein